jgi:hypothetical protein
MIDTDKMKAALAATPLCQGAWTEKDGDNPTMLCAVSAMVSFAGVQPDLIKKMADTLGGEEWFRLFAAPVLTADYGIPYNVANRIPRLFDSQENEWRGVTEVLALCERCNMEELHADAIYEDGVRFPQGVMSLSFASNIVWSTAVLSASGVMWVQDHQIEKPVVVKAPKLPKTEKQKNAPWLGKGASSFKVLGY